MPVSSSAWTVEQASAEDERVATVLQLGPALSVRGGVATVEGLILKHVGAGIRIHHIATMEEGALWRGARVFANALWTLHRALRSQRRVVVHIHFASRGSTLRKVVLAWMTLRARRPLILHAHGAGFDEFHESLPRVAQRLLHSVFSRADCLIVLSTQWRDFYTARCGFPAQRVKILHNPTETPERVPDRAGRARTQFLFLGRIGWRKGAFDLLHAFGTLDPQVRARARLVFAGDGDVATLQERSAVYGDNVVVHAWIGREQREALLAESDVFVLPSHQEGVPMAMLEAMAPALPVVATPVGGIPDVIGDGCEGLLVPESNPVALARAMQALIEDEKLRLTLGARARARAQTFDVREYSAQLTRLYQRLLAA